MCGGGGSKPAPKPATPTYSYFPESARTQQQQVAAAQTPNTGASYGSELAGAGSATPAATPAKVGM
jgi:hypothetical protein